MISDLVAISDLHTERILSNLTNCSIYFTLILYYAHLFSIYLIESCIFLKSIMWKNIFLYYIQFLMSFLIIYIGCILIHIWVATIPGPLTTNVDDGRLLAEPSYPQCTERHSRWQRWPLWHHSAFQKSLPETCIPVYQNDGFTIHTVSLSYFFKNYYISSLALLVWFVFVFLIFSSFSLYYCLFFIY